MDPELQGLPPTIGRYEVRGLLGRGGMGRVVAGHDPVLRRDVAIKIVEPSAVAIEDLPELRYMFHREARATASLRHPNVVEVFDYSGPDAELMFIAIELLDGPTLAEVLQGRPGLGVRTVAALGYELASALDAAHRGGIVHRDLKPENVFWTREGRIVLSDFGIAKAFDGSDKLGGTLQFGATSLYGSPSYIAPEQISGGVVGGHTDLYALGTVLYECLCGQQAYGGADVRAILEAVAQGSHTPLHQLVDAPPRLVRLVESLLSVRPEDRPDDARQVGDELRGVLDTLQVGDPRLVLRGHGDETVAFTVGAGRADGDAAADTGDDGDPDGDETEVRLFAPPAQPEGIRVPRGGSGWATLATRGPVLLGMLGLAVALGAGGYLFVRLGDSLKDVGSVFVSDEADPVVSTDPTSPPDAAASQDVFVLLELDGRQTVFIDGMEIGTWEDRVRLALPPGRHRIEARSAAGTVTRDVLLIPDTDPVFRMAP